MSGFKIPLDFNFSEGKLYETNLVKGNDIESAINDFINLIIDSPNGSFKPDLDFGFSLKNSRFENATEPGKGVYEINGKNIKCKSKDQDSYAFSLTEAIKKFEPRLINPQVTEDFNKSNSEVLLSISGLLQSGEKYEQKIKFYIWKT
jgi:hypothetical protein